MINSLTLDNFKAHKHTELTFERLTVLVGPNGGGKTSVLEALHGVAGFGESRWTFDDSAPHRPGPPSRFDVKVAGLAGSEQFSVSFAANRNPQLGWNLRVELSSGPQGTAEHFQDLAAAGTLGTRALWDELRTPGILRLDARKIAEPGEWASAQDNDGKNTSSALARLKLADDPRFDAIVDALRGLIPAVRSVRLPPVGSSSSARNTLEFDFAHAERIPARAVSDGTLVLLALLTALHGPDRPRLLLIDDIEQTLHPTAQMELMDFILNLLDQDKDLQIVATTHSPFILDRLDPKQVRVFFPREDGSIAVRPLTDHPDAKRAVGTLTAGQIWTLDPEKWVLENA